MFRSTLLRGVSVGALTIHIFSSALAQEALPTIEVGAARPVAGGSGDGQERIAA